MANESLSKNSPKLNITRRQSELFQNIILVGNKMSEALAALDKKMLLPKGTLKLVLRWTNLMRELALMLID